jgi:DNA-binding NarL/FixJ family response regulator
MLRRALECLLAESSIEVLGSFADDQSLTETLTRPDCPDCEVVVQVLSGNGPFAAFRRIHTAMGQSQRNLRLVVLAEHAARGQVYAALRVGAKAYVDLDADPKELAKAVIMAAEDKVYLSPDAAELLVKDVSSAIEPNASSRLPQVDLSRRETEIVQLLCEGLSGKEIARNLHISPKTVENHRYNIYRKCGVDSLASLMRHAIQNGMVTI